MAIFDEIPDRPKSNICPCCNKLATMPFMVGNSDKLDVLHYWQGAWGFEEYCCSDCFDLKSMEE